MNRHWSRLLPFVLVLPLSCSGAGIKVAAAPSVPGSRLAPGASNPDWLAQAQSQAEMLEYEFHADAAGQWSAPNRAQDLRLRVQDGAVEVTPRRASPPPWKLKLRVAAWGRAGQMSAIPAPAATVSGATLTLLHGTLIQTVQNQPQGVEHALELPAAPPGSAAGAVLVELNVQGGLSAMVSKDGTSVLFEDAGGTPRAYYRDLRVTDASGKELPASMSAAAGSLVLEFDDSNAVYPVQVDPILQGPVWSVFQAADTSFGERVGSAGDLNGDGFDDVFVTAPRYDGGAPSSGAVFVYFGSPAGPSFEPDWMMTTAQHSSYLGRVAAVGDVNADGNDDLLIATNLAQGIGGDTGTAWLWYGGPSAWATDGSPTNADWSLTVTSEDFGVSLTGGRDLSGDGQADFCISAPGWNSSRGRVHVFHGKPGGPGASADALIQGTHPAGRFGAILDGTGDFDGNGQADLLAGESHDGSTAELRIHWGGPALATAPPWSRSFSVASERLRGAAAAGDVDGDGDDELLLSTVNLNSDLLVHLLPGGAAGPGATPFWTVSHANVPLPDSSYVQIALVAGAGDVNQDGFDDVLVGYHRFTQGISEQGRVDLILGSELPKGLPARTILGFEANLNLSRAAGAGDVNQDGFPDIILGAPGNDDAPASVNAAFLFYGGANTGGLNADWDYQSDQNDAYLGSAIAFGTSFNGDARADVLIAAPLLETDPGKHGQAYAFFGQPFGLPSAPDYSFNPAVALQNGFGAAVASAGDVNGDGNDDALVTAFLNGQTLTRRVDLRPGPFSDPSLAPSIYIGPWADHTYGRVVAGLGDVNGDGLDDFAICSPEITNQEPWQGRVEIRHGDPSTFQVPTSAAAAPARTLYGSQAGEQLGATIASSDVNGDGYQDLILGAPGFDTAATADAGRIEIYYGGPQGIPAQPDRTLSLDDTKGLGLSLAGGLDFNGDGIQDFLAGGRRYGLEPHDSGFVLCFEGSPSGPVLLPWLFTLGVEGSLYGSAIAAAGDLNGDGQDDFLVGAPMSSVDHPQEGVVYAFSGASLATTSIETLWLRAGGGAAFRFGAALAGGGDVNGDGLPDLLVGAPGFSEGENAEGAVFLFLTAPPVP